MSTTVRSRASAILRMVERRGIDLPLSIRPICLIDTREAAGLSKEGLAAQAGVSYKTVERLEAGTAIPRRATLTVITAALGIDLEPTTGAAA
jgi:predicted transcriptional regulator